MPIYEYSCKKCGQTIEVIQKMSDPELKKHKGCGGALTKEISASAFQFKGTGWYVTDYAKKSDKGGEDANARETQESANKKESESKEKKPAATGSKDTGKAPESKESKASKPSSDAAPTKSSGKKE